MKFWSSFKNHNLEIKSISQIGKQISYLLKRSFFSVKDLLTIKEKKAVSVLRKIAKTENIYLSKKEAKEILKTLNLLQKSKKIKNINSLVSFGKLFKFAKDKIVIKVKTFVLLFVNFFDHLFNFRLDFQKILRN